ncbi:hypothetical protein MSG28_008954 [Choristoneura fumiferana]|uniref:Uncharacterized protein n=1 Tax=Choristoneura fumiferana TaxID=7141 RepID=A0ACC0J8L7_CHOFU|nr:hypothetical protein MSG28_008954 [Choristoneura fumiferana]
MRKGQDRSEWRALGEAYVQQWTSFETDDPGGTSAPPSSSNQPMNATLDPANLQLDPGVTFWAPPPASNQPINDTLLDPASLQLLDFRLRHPRPVGVLTTSAGKPLEVRESLTLNTDVFNNPYFHDLQTSLDQERIPERVVHAKGNGAFGYFEVTNDVSKYTSADVFNDVGKRTPLAARFSGVIPSIGGSDLTIGTRGFAVKMYTNEGNLDFLGLHLPVYFYRYLNMFSTLSHGFKRNPKTNLIDPTMRAELLTVVPESIHNFMRLLSDYGQPNGYRKMDGHLLHTYELNNKHGESFFVKFSMRSEQGTEYLTEVSAARITALDPDYFGRDLYNAIATGNYPSWRFEMDVMTKEQITKVNFNPFDVTRTWDNGTYKTVTIGRIVLNRNPDNFFRDVEQAAYNPGNLVPGIPGPPDDMYKTRRMAYRDTQNYRLGINNNNIEVNRPKYRKVYNRDGHSPVRDNMRDAPNYYENSFNGPVPYVDVARPRERLKIYDRNAVDLQPPADFYNEQSEGGKTRLATNAAVGLLVNAVPFVQERALKLFYLIDRDLGRRVELALAAARATKAVPTVVTPINDNPRVVEVVPNPIPR